MVYLVMNLKSFVPVVTFVASGTIVCERELS